MVKDRIKTKALHAGANYKTNKNDMSKNGFSTEGVHQSCQLFSFRN